MLIKQYTLSAGILLMLFLSACKKNSTAEEDNPAAALNLYSASDVQVKQSLNRYVFIDMPVDTVPAQNLAVPVFTNDQQEYPVVYHDPYHLITYTRMTAGSHRLLFTDTGRLVIHDTALILAKDSYTTLYITDAGHTGEPASYQSLSVAEDRHGTRGRVRVRVINLSPDIGSISCYQEKADGKTLFSPLPQQLAFCKASDYVELDTTGATDGKLNLRVIADDDPLNPLVLTRIPASPGHAYVMVVQGFRQATTRQVPFGKNADGSLKYRTTDITANVRVTLRQSY